MVKNVATQEIVIAYLLLLHVHETGNDAFKQATMRTKGKKMRNGKQIRARLDKAHKRCVEHAHGAKGDGKALVPLLKLL